MPEALHPGGRTWSRKFLTSCVCLGLVLLTSVCAWAAVTVPGPGTFGISPALNRRDTDLTLIFTVPQGFEAASGEARLLPASGESAEAIAGTFSTSNSKVTAIFQLQRGWEKKSFAVIELAGQPFPLEPLVPVDPIRPRTLVIEPDLQATTEKSQFFRALSSEALGENAKLCDDGLYLKQGGFKVTAGPTTVSKNGLDVQLAIVRPKEVSDADLVLEICDQSARWVYTGRLLDLSPVPSHALKIDVAHEGEGSIKVVLRPEVKARGSAILETKVLEGPPEPPELRPEAILPFRREGESYIAEVPVNCATGRLTLRNLTLLARDEKSNPHLFRHTGDVLVCPDDEPPFWSLLALIIIALMAIAYLVYRLRRDRHSSKARSHTPSTLPDSERPKATPSTEQRDLEALQHLFSESLQRDLAPLERGIKELKMSLADLREGSSIFRVPDPSRELEKPDGLVLASDAFPGGAETSLAELVNRWWREGSDRARADLLVQNPSIKAYRSFNIQESLRNLTNRTFMFQVTDGPMEWLGRQQQGELLIVPCDPRLFETGDSLKFLGDLFDGLGRNLEKIRFRRVVRPCRLQQDLGSQDRYRLVQRGQIELEGKNEAESSPSAAQPVALARMPHGNTPASMGLSETKLVTVVRDAIAGAIPSDLSTRVEELSRQVRSLRESEPRNGTEPVRLDPNVLAVLDGIRQGVSSFDRELHANTSAIQEIMSLVEVLRGDLFRIESQLQRDPAPSAAGFPKAQASGGSQFPDLVEASEIDAAVDDRLREEPMQPPSQEARFDTGAPWRLPEPAHIPQQLQKRLDKWWPKTLPSAESSPDGDNLPEPSAYLWRLEETGRVLTQACGQRGWQVKLVHLSVPEGPAQRDSVLQILEPVSIAGDYRSASYKGSPFTDALLFQFALSIHGDDSQDIALLPAAGLRMDKHHHAYSRLTLGNLPEIGTRLIQLIQPAILSPIGQSGLYTVASPLKAEFR